MSIILNEELRQDKRFVVDSNYLQVNKAGDPAGKIIFLTDYKYWDAHYKELQEWAALNHAIIHGMTVVILNERDVTSFIIRWS